MSSDELIQSRKDIRLIGRAVRERWPISTEFRARIVAQLMTIVMSPEASDRDIVAATRVLASIDKMNVDLENAAKNMTLEELKDELRERLLEIAPVQEAPESDDGTNNRRIEQ